jgi:hypothetical protein
MSPADYVITLFGGVRPLARAIHVDHSTVSRWRKPISEKGTGGDVPTRQIRKILAAAKVAGLPIDRARLIGGDDA